MQDKLLVSSPDDLIALRIDVAHGAGSGLDRVESFVSVEVIRRGITSRRSS